MTNIFNIEEQSRLQRIVNDYRAIYEQASYLAIQIEKMDSEMQELIQKKDTLKDEETTIYNEASVRTAIDIEEVKKEAAEIVLANQVNTSPISKN